MRTRLLLPMALLALSALAGCSVVDRVRGAPAELSARWALLPIANHTEAPQAGLRAEAIAETVLRSIGVKDLERYPAALNPETLLEPSERKLVDAALAWAKAKDARYAVTGAVEEWRYKVGVDGEPAVGISISVIDLRSGAVVYSASGGKSGWSREAVSAVAQKLLRELFADLGALSGASGMGFGSWLTGETHRPLWHWLETVLLTLVAAALAAAASPQDPLFTAAAFPWVLFAPALLALRYGVLPGLGSMVVLAGVWWLERAAGMVRPEPPTLYFMGGLLLTLVCGEFASIWNARLRRTESTYRYAREKLDRLTRQHYLLLLSHDRLEQDQLARPVTLRAALVRIRALIAGTDNTDPAALPGLPAMAALLAQFCQLEVASFHACANGVPEAQPRAAIGPAQPLDADDPLVRHCLANQALAHVRMGELAGKTGARYLVVAPVRNLEGRLLALFAIEQMPFLALHDEALSTLQVLLGYYADALQVSRQARVVQRALPRCPIEFAAELMRVHRMRAEFEVPSTLLLLRFGGHPDSAAFSQLLRRQLRDLDTVWELPPRPGALAPVPDLLALLPLAGAAGAEGALTRLENALQLRHLVGFDGARIRTHDTQLVDADPFVTLKLFLDQHDVRL